MDPFTALGAASAITALLSFSASILSNGYTYVSQVIRAPHELRQLLIEVAALNSLLDHLQLLLEDGHEEVRSAVISLEQAGAIAESKDILDRVDVTLAKCRQSEGQAAKNLGKRMLWPFQERETKDLIGRFQRIRDNFTSALSLDAVTALKRIEPSVHNIDRATARLVVNDDRRNLELENGKLISWLAYENVYIEDDLENGLSRRQIGTNTWFLEGPEFGQWLSEDSAFLCICGIPGAGKTILLSTIIEYLRSVRRDGDGLIFFFCSDNDPKKRDLRNFIGNGLSQLLNQAPGCKEDLKELFLREKGDSGTKPSLVKCVQLLKAFTLRFRKVHIVMDALDECSGVEAFIECLDELRSSANSKTTAKVLITSRFNVITDRIAEKHQIDLLSLTNNISGDIHKFLAEQVTDRSASGKLKVRDFSLRDHIVTTLSERADGMFLWASIQLDRICELTRDRDIRKCLSTLPIGLNDTFTRILQHLEAERSHSVNDVKHIFQWLIGSFLPVSLELIAEALAILPGDLALDQDGIANDIEDLALLCGPLITVDAMEDDWSITRITFAHLSIAEFLKSDSIKAGAAANFHTDIAVVHSELARKCVQYLSFSDFENPCSQTQLSKRVNKYKLLTYASQYWIEHLKASQMTHETFQTECLPYLQWFLYPSPSKLNFASWTQIFHCAMPGFAAGRYSKQLVTRQPPIFYALLYGVDLLLGTSFPDGLDLHQRYWDRMTPFLITAYAGHTAIALKLLRIGANVHDTTQAKGLTCLHLAAEHGHAAMVDLLLASGADPHARTRSGATPFYRSPRGGSMAVMQMLRDHGSEIDAATWDNWTALHEAVLAVEVPMIEQLLAWGADPEICTLSGDTPVTFAKLVERPDIVKLLVRHQSVESLASLNTSSAGRTDQSID